MTVKRNIRTQLWYAITCLLLVLHTSAGFAQGENNIWAFGLGAGFDFSTSPPTFFRSLAYTAEGCATVCNSEGRLQFYSDGKHVWDRNGDVMRNGDGILGNWGGAATIGSATQGVAIVPFINDINKYYIFTVDCTENIYKPRLPGYLRYSIVDMSLNSGLGEVVEKNIVLDTGTGEKMIVVRGGQCHLWLLVHMHSTGEFKAYKIDDTGKIHEGISSFTSSFDDSTIQANYKMYMVGEMKVSPDARLIALTTGRLVSGENAVELYRFNFRTGRVSDPIQIYSDKNSLYGLSFSPSSRLLYIGAGDGSGRGSPLMQFDVSAFPDSIALTKSRMPIATTAGMGGMRIGPDGKIYITSQSTDIIHCINNPDERGKACNLTVLDYALPDSVRFMLGFGNHVYSYNDVRRPTVYNRHDTFLCRGETEIELSAPEGYASYTWYDGSTGRQKIAYGKNIWVRSEDNCREVIDTFNVNPCNDCLYMPTAFSPNNDGKNDRFRPVARLLNYFHIYIYDRWGTLVYHSDNVNEGWNGMNASDLCDVGTYFYYIKAQCYEGIEFILKGDVTLIR